MTRITVKLDVKGIQEILKSPGMRRVINDKARQVAAAAGPDAQVEEYTTDRDAAAVVVKDYKSMGRQAKTGFLTKAAGSAGLEVKARR